ncbi:MAG: hypothetical protein U5K37_09415 [Natrialbaceae archaeon]|nr:hypothetical protein [Natrialbaceae archaeon]
MTVEFSTTADGDVAVLDPDANRRMTLRLDGTAALSPASDSLPLPVDRTVQLRTTTIQVEDYAMIDVHDGSGRTIRTIEAGQEAVLEEAAAIIAINGPIKLFATVSPGCTVSAGLNAVSVTYEGQHRVVLGGRSLQTRPTETITTPPDPESMMAAVSALSSALKTTSPERSWPTLRDHPPLLELGESLEIPVDCEPPETGITLQVPRSREAIFTVAPLAYYLGATLEPGSHTRLETDAASMSLEDDLEANAARLLKHSLVLDCIVRTEGLYPDPLEERIALEGSLPFDPSTMYERPIADRLEAYLEVPFDVTTSAIPRWPLTAYLPADPSAIEAVPFVLDELGTIRSQRDAETAAGSPVQVADGELVRSSDVEARVEPTTYDRLNRPQGALVHAWFGRDVPVGASLATVPAYRNGLEVEPRDGTIDILIVCNEVDMLQEHDQIASSYVTQGSFDVEVTSRFGVSTSELATLLTDGDADLFHFIGHTTAAGLECHDGHLDIGSLESVTPTAFFLNACRSRRQGLAMLERGAVGGVCTMAEVVNQTAIAMGETVANLLSVGYPLSAGLSVARRVLDDTEEYLVVGDASLALIQPIGGVPSLLSVDDAGETVDLSLEFFTTPTQSIGSTVSDAIRPSAPCKLLPATFDRATVDDEVLEEYLLWTDHPVIRDDTIHWTEPLSAVEFSQSD